MPTSSIWKALFYVPVLILASISPAVWAADSPDSADALIAAVSVYKHVLIRRYDGSPRRNMDESPEHAAVVWVEGMAISSIAREKLAAAGIVLKSQSEIRDEQLATFLKLTKLPGGGMLLAYELPAQASDGVFMIEEKAVNLELGRKRQTRSASGAREFYAQLYAGLECMDGSEMAYRWNFDQNELAAAHGRYSGVCLAARYPPAERYPAP